MVTCSKDMDADLFDGVLGGLGQFGIITRARIPLVPAPARARLVRLVYTDVAALTADQERLIAERAGGALGGLLDYVEGSVITDFQIQDPIKSRRSQAPSSFFSNADVIYYLEGALYYGGGTDTSIADAEKVVEVLLRELGHARGSEFVQDVSYVEFLDRFRAGEAKLRAHGLWDKPHPWLNLFLPSSRILDFASGVFHGGLLRRGGGGGGGGSSPLLVHPMNRARWDGGMSAVYPDEEEVFYRVGILRSAAAGRDELRRMEEQNAAVVRFCAGGGIPCTQYLPHYATQAEWAARHFGSDRWERFVQRKREYDPMAILARGHKIFSHPLAVPAIVRCPES